MAKESGPGKYWLPTGADKRLIEAIIREVKRMTVNQGSRPGTDHSWSEGEDHQSPEVYIASPLNDGFIPALVAGTGGAPDVPGQAECDVYAITDEGLRAVEGLTRFVYNLSDADLSGWMLVHRDKFGNWVASVSTGGDTSFWAILTDKTAILFETGSPPFGNRYYGSYSWIEAETDPATGIYLRDANGNPVPREGGLFGIKGEVDAGREINLSNANCHLENMVVRMYRGPLLIPSSDIPSSEQISSCTEGVSSLRTTDFSYWFDLNTPREDGPDVVRYIVAHAVGNDTLV